MTEQDNTRDAAPVQALGTARVAALTDGVFTIVLTLLVLDLHTQHAATQMQLLSQLRGLAPQFASFVISFAVLGVFWYGHHMELHFIVRSDRVHLGITLAFLLTIALVPFSASLLGRNYEFPLAATIYGVNLCLAGMVRLVATASCSYRQGGSLSRLRSRHHRILAQSGSRQPTGNRIHRRLAPAPRRCAELFLPRRR
jgi:uncharacterized membrane protein